MPYRYLRHLFTELPPARTLDNYRALLPFNHTPEQIGPPMSGVWS